MRIVILRGLLLASLLVFCATAGATTFTDTFHGVDPLFNTNQAGGAGITFTPARALIAPPETIVPQTVYLLDWTFAKSSSGYGGSGMTFLAVTTYDSTSGYGRVVGLSTHGVDFSTTDNGAPMTWPFDYVPLDTDTEYAMLFVNEQLELTGGGVELEVSEAYPWGGFIQSGNITVNQPNWNAHFVATYSTVTPRVSVDYPLDGAINVETDVELSWTGPNAYVPLGYDVYVDPNALNLTAHKAMYRSVGQLESTFVPSPALAYDTTYYWRVDVLEPNEVGSQQPILHTGPVWTFTTAPAAALIVEQPVSQTVAPGATVEFSVTATNADTYQWYKDDVALDNETGAALVLEDVQVDDEAFYHCVVDNSLNLPAVSERAQLVTTRLMGWWKLDGDLTDAVAESVPGAMPHHGVSSDPNFILQGVKGGALRLTGSADGLVIIPDSAEAYNFYPRGYTISAWVNMPAKSGAWGAYVAKQGFDPPRGFILTHNAGGQAVHTLRQMTPADLSSNVDVDDNTWHLVTGTYDAATKVSEVYVDGVLRNSITYTGTPTGSPADLIFGAENLDATTAAYAGLLDDVRLWSYPLDPVSVAWTYVAFVPEAKICVEYPQLDLAGPEGVGEEFRDCVVDLYDFAAFALQWLECNTVPNCLPQP